MRTVYVVGQPGAGKTTAMAGALKLLRWKVIRFDREPVPHLHYDSGAVQLGTDRTEMGGTDSLSMSIGPRAIDWVRTGPCDLLLGEGDRLAYEGFLAAAEGAGSLDLVWLDLPPAVARERAAARASLSQTKAQNEAWVKGRIRKVERLCAPRRHTRIDGSAPPARVARALAAIIAGAGKGT